MWIALPGIRTGRGTVRREGAPRGNERVCSVHPSDDTRPKICHVDQHAGCAIPQAARRMQAFECMVRSAPRASEAGEVRWVVSECTRFRERVTSRRLPR